MLDQTVQHSEDRALRHSNACTCAADPDRVRNIVHQTMEHIDRDAFQNAFGAGYKIFGLPRPMDFPVVHTISDECRHNNTTGKLKCGEAFGIADPQEQRKCVIYWRGLYVRYRAGLDPTCATLSVYVHEHVHQSARARILSEGVACDLRTNTQIPYRHDVSGYMRGVGILIPEVSRRLHPHSFILFNEGVTECLSRLVLSHYLACQRTHHLTCDQITGFNLLQNQAAGFYGNEVRLVQILVEFLAQTLDLTQNDVWRVFYQDYVRGTDLSMTSEARCLLDQARLAWIVPVLENLMPDEVHAVCDAISLV